VIKAMKKTSWQFGKVLVFKGFLAFLSWQTILATWQRGWQKSVWRTGEQPQMFFVFFKIFVACPDILPT